MSKKILLEKFIYEKKRAKKSLYNRTYREKPENKDKTVQYYQDNKEHILSQQKEYIRKNKEKVQKYRWLKKKAKMTTSQPPKCGPKSYKKAKMSIIYKIHEKVKINLSKIPNRNCNSTDKRPFGCSCCSSTFEEYHGLKGHIKYMMTYNGTHLQYQN